MKILYLCKKAFFLLVFNFLACLVCFAQSVQVNIDWNKTIGEINGKHWGVNDEQIRNPDYASNGGFNDYLKQLKPALIRLHHASLTESWCDSTTGKWNVEKIKASLTSATGYADAKLLLNIPRWPSWLAPVNLPLPAEKQETFIQLCADLVLIMRDSLKRDIAYWEILNEREKPYDKEGRLSELWSLINRVSDRIKTIDPGAKVGGPAFTSPKSEWVESFLDSCANHIDFITWHNYASPNPETSNDQILIKAVSVIDKGAKDVVEILKRRGLSKDTFLDEFNIQWVWKPFEIRHTNSIGAIFQACVVRSAALNGLTGAAVWHLKGDSYGLISSANKQRATGSMYLWGTNYLQGKIAGSVISDSSIEAMPVILGNGNKSLLLLNKSAKQIRVIDGSRLLKIKKSKSMKAFIIDSTGFLPKLFHVNSGDILMPAYSAMLLTTVAK